MLPLRARAPFPALLRTHILAVSCPRRPGGTGHEHSPENLLMGVNLFDLTGKAALVTGGSKGLGKAMARGLTEAGADVVISSRHEDELRAALEEILRGTSRRGCAIVADMSRRREAGDLAKMAFERMGRV